LNNNNVFIYNVFGASIVWTSHCIMLRNYDGNDMLFLRCKRRTAYVRVM